MEPQEQDYEFLRNFYNETRHRQVQRPPMNQIEFDNKYGYLEKKKSDESGGGQFKKQSTKFIGRYYEPFTSLTNFKLFIYNLIPILRWLLAYDCKTNLSQDVIAGITVGVMHVPQGIAYAILSKQDPIIGLYTSIFPVLIYMVFGTSRHASIGSFAVVSLMTGLAVQREAYIPGETAEHLQSTLPSAIEVSCTLVLVVGLVQFVMGILRLQFLTTYFSDQLVAGFTTGASVHVLVAQFKELFGLRGLTKHAGPGYIVRNVFDILINLPNSNWMCVAISAVTMIILHCGKEFINPIIKKKTQSNIPIPWEVFVVILSTIFIAVIDGKVVYNVRIVDVIPTGLPTLSIPRLDLIPKVLQDGISIAVVVVAVHISLSKMLSKRFNYPLDAGQELFAVSFVGIGCSVLPTYPSSCGLGRTMVGVESGGKTQLTGLFSSILVLSITLYFGKFLETLPMCVLSAIITVSLKSMLWKLGDLQGLWRLSKIDFWIWVVAFLATVVVDVSEGLIIAVMFALFTTILREQYPKWHLLANVKDTEEFRDTQRYQETIYYKGICIFRFDAPLLFHNVECFKKCVEKAYEEWKKSGEYNVVLKENNHGKKEHEGIRMDRIGHEHILPVTVSSSTVLSRHFVIDCGGITFIDLMGVSALKEIFSELRKKGLQVYFAAAKAPVRDMFEKCKFFEFVTKDHFYPTLRDATQIARCRQNQFGFLDTSQIPEFDQLSEATSAIPQQ